MVIHAYGLNLHKVCKTKSESSLQFFSWEVTITNCFLRVLPEKGCAYYATHLHTVMYLDFFSLTTRGGFFSYQCVEVILIAFSCCVILCHVFMLSLFNQSPFLVDMEVVVIVLLFQVMLS